MTKISQLTDIGANLAANDEFIIRDVSDASTPNKKVTSSGFVDYVISQGSVTGFTQIAAGVGPLARALASSSGATGTLAFSTAAATTLVERARIDSSGRLLVGTSTARANFLNAGETTKLQIEGAVNISAVRTDDTAYPSWLILGKTRSTGNTIVQSGDIIGRVAFEGNDGSEFVDAAFISAEVDGTPGANAMPGRIVLSTTAAGASTPTEAMRIDSTGLMTLAGPGIKFPATQVASADPNTLDDYEEGSITGMTVTGGTSGTMATSSLVGKYVKIGDLVTVNIYLRQSTTTAVGSYFIINGALPFTPGGNPFYLYTATFSNYLSATSVVAQILGGAPSIYVVTDPALIANGQEMTASATYKINNP